MRVLILFDIDGTLIHCRGAGLAAMTRAGRKLFCPAFGFDGISPAGALDHDLLTAASQACGLTPDPTQIEAFVERYCLELAEELASRADAGRPVEVMAGVTALLERVGRESMVPGLMTGNFAASARIKLEAAGIGFDGFVVTAFSGDGERRPHLVPAARRRFERRFGRAIEPASIIVVGDTPADVAAARENGCVSIAVATGPFSSDELSGTDADLVLEDLSDTEAIVRFIAAATMR